MFDITPILVAILIAIFGFIGAKVIPLIKAKVSKEDREMMMFWVEIGVNAAEQLCKAGVIKKEDRKQHVIDFLKSKGITVDMDTVEEMLESCVNELPPLVDKE